MYDPMPHQVEDSNHLLEYQHGLLWADPGTGKTVTAMEGYRKGGYDGMIVICPKIALDMWAEEVQKHLGLTYWVFRSGRIPKGFWGFSRVRCLITTFDLAKNFDDLFYDFYSYFRTPDKRSRILGIIDEAHRCKSPTAKRTKAILGPQFKLYGGVLEHCEDVWQLTGTPATSHVNDLYTQLCAARFDLLKHFKVETYDNFVAEFCTTELRRYSKFGPPTRVITGSKNLDKLERLLEACRVVRRKLSDVWDDMPGVTYRKMHIDLSEKVEGIGNMTDKEIAAALNDPDSPMAKIRRLLGAAKVKGIADYCEEFAMKPTLIGLWHRDAIESLRHELIAKGQKVRTVTGSTPDREREVIKNQFNEGTIDFLVGQMGAMRESWNLQKKSHHIIIGEEDASPSTITQFVARVARGGQENHVQVDILHSRHDLDAALERLRSNKAAVMERANI